MSGSTVFDSSLFRDMFGTPEMHVVFSDHAYLRAVVRIEVALARVHARLGIIPRDAADAIAAWCDATRLDHERLRRDTDIVGYPILSRSKTRSRVVSWGFAAGSGAWLGPSRGAVVDRLPLGEVPVRPAGGAGPL